MRKTIIILLALHFNTNLYSKVNINSAHISTTMGQAWPITSIRKGHGLESLIGYPDKHFSIAFDAGLVLNRKHIFMLSFSVALFVNGNSNSFQEYANSILSTNYIVEKSIYVPETIGPTRFSIGYGSILNCRKLLLKPSFGLGVISFETIRTNVFAKEKNTNFQYRIDFSSSLPNSTSLTKTFACQAIYPINKVFHLSTQFTLNNFKPTINYVVRGTNLFNEEVTELDQLHVNHNIWNFSAMVGITLILKKNHGKS